MTFEKIQEISKEAQTRLTKMTERFPWENRDAYISWLAQTYEYASRSTRILALTAGHFPLDKTLHATRFIQHAAEEKGHDRLLSNDAKALGVDLLTVPALPEAEAFHKSLYFWIYQGRPSVILGWVLCLETVAVQNGPAAYKRVKNAFGDRAASFLRVHAHEDPDHVAKAIETVRQLSEEDRKDVGHGLKLYASLYENIYQAIETQVSAQTRKAA
jgi:pyrroloquinoline quinone (PQQ) biosynthesis protein C